MVCATRSLQEGPMRPLSSGLYTEGTCGGELEDVTSIRPVFRTCFKYHPVGGQQSHSCKSFLRYELVRRQVGHSREGEAVVRSKVCQNGSSI